MRPVLKELDASYRTRAVPAGTARYWSWLFAAAEARAALVGIYALRAEWEVLTDPATDISVAHLKLAWWREEMQRLTARSPVHPVSAYLAALPHAGEVDFSPLIAAVDAAAAQVSGVPLERMADLLPQSQALWGAPLLLASQLAGQAAEDTGLGECTRGLAAAQYLAAAIRDYRRQASAGRVPFAVDELMAEGIGNDDLLAALPPPHLGRYLELLRARAARFFDIAPRQLSQQQCVRHRHLVVLAALGADRLHARAPSAARARLSDMLLAWNTARRAGR